MHENVTFLPILAISRVNCVQLPLQSSASLPLLTLSPPLHCAQLPLPAPASLPRSVRPGST